MPLCTLSLTFPPRRRVLIAAKASIDDGNSVAHSRRIINPHGDHTSLSPIQGTEPSKSECRDCSGAIQRASCTLLLHVSKDTYT